MCGDNLTRNNWPHNERIMFHVWYQQHEGAFLSPRSSDTQIPTDTFCTKIWVAAWWDGMGHNSSACSTLLRDDKIKSWVRLRIIKSTPSTQVMLLWVTLTSTQVMLLWVSPSPVCMFNLSNWKFADPMNLSRNTVRIQWTFVLWLRGGHSVEN
jgi:hypothetical protein